MAFCSSCGAGPDSKFCCNEPISSDMQAPALAGAMFRTRAGAQMRPTADGGVSDDIAETSDYDIRHSDKLAGPSEPDAGEIPLSSEEPREALAPPKSDRRSKRWISIAAGVAIVSVLAGLIPILRSFEAKGWNLPPAIDAFVCPPTAVQEYTAPASSEPDKHLERAQWAMAGIVVDTRGHASIVQVLSSKPRYERLIRENFSRTTYKPATAHCRFTVGISIMSTSTDGYDPGPAVARLMKNLADVYNEKR